MQLFSRNFNTKQTNKRTDKQTNIQTDRQTNKQTYRQTNRQTDKQTNIQKNKHTDKQTDRQTPKPIPCRRRLSPDEVKQEALLSQRGRAMLVSVCSFNSTIPRAQSFIISYFGFRFNQYVAYNSVLFFSACTTLVNDDTRCSSSHRS